MGIDLYRWDTARKDEKMLYHASAATMAEAVVEAMSKNISLRHIKLVSEDLSGVDFSGCDLRGADFTCAKLNDAKFDGADLSGAYFWGARLCKASFKGVRGIPIVDKLHLRMLEALRKGGVLNMLAWHDHDDAVEGYHCSTSHCRAGWTVHLAGIKGYALEARVGTRTAAVLIGLASCPELNGDIPDFYDSEDGALEDIKRLAALEAQR